MQNSGPLVPFGYAIMLLTGLLISVPYLKRRSDAVTAWNLMLLGCFIFLGIGSLEVVYGDFHWPELKWFQPTPSDVDKFMFGGALFMATLIVSYYWLMLPRRIAAKVLNTWPPMSPPVVYMVLGFCAAFAVAALFTRRILFLNMIFTVVSFKAILFATVFSFCYWYRQKIQVPILVLFLVTFGTCLLYAMTVYAGRRLLLSVASAPLICLYWLKWRYESPKRVAIYLSGGLFGALLLSGIYSTFRHTSASPTGEENRTFSIMLQAVKNAKVADGLKKITDQSLHYFSQYAIHNSLLTIHLIDTKTMQTAPLNSMLYLVSYPVPRRLWPDKPDILGQIVVHEVLNLPYQTNWGMGIVGISYYEGGYLTLMLYAFLAVVGIRIIDDNLVRQPDNMFLLSILCYGAPHIIAWTRGESVIMTTTIVEACVFAWILGTIARILFGTVRQTTHPGGQTPVYGQQYSQLGHAGR